MKLILASQSPRRKELLEGLGYAFEVIPSSSEEIFDPALPLDEAIKRVALEKAYNVFDRHPQDIVLAADTIVLQDGNILGKPRNKEDAFRMLKGLSGRWHEVKTGMALVCSSHVFSGTETTRVHFRTLSDQEILDYVNRGTCLDKAGSYGIQETDFVDQYEGSYSNVVGLPLTRTDMLLKETPKDPRVSF